MKTRHYIERERKKDTIGSILVAIVNHVIGKTSNVGVHLSERRAVAVLGVMHPDDDGRIGLVNDDTLRRLVSLFATSLHVRRAFVVIIFGGFGARESVPLVSKEKTNKQTNKTC